MVTKERNKAATASYLFLRRGDEILLARRCNTGYQDGNYQVPAGHIDAGELPSEAAVREAREEIGIDIDPKNLLFVHTIFRPKIDDTGDRVDYFFEVSEWQGEITNMEPGKCNDLRWVNISALPSNMTPHVRVAIERTAQGKVFSELGVEFLRVTGFYGI